MRVTVFVIVLRLLAIQSVAFDLVHVGRNEMASDWLVD